MNIKRFERCRGFTLVELLIVMGMMGLVSTAMFSLYQDNSRSARTEEDVVELQQTLRITIDKIADDIRLAGFLVTSEYSSVLMALQVNDAAGVPRSRLAFRTGSAQAQILALAPDDIDDESNIMSFSGDADDTDAAANKRALNVASAEQLRMFETGQCVRVYRNAKSQPVTRTASPFVPYLFRVTSVTPSTSKMVLQAENFGTVQGDFMPGDMVARVYGTGTDLVPCGSTAASQTPAGNLPEFVIYEIVLITNMPRDTTVSPPLEQAIRIRRIPGYCLTETCNPYSATHGKTINDVMDLGTQFTNPASSVVALETKIPRITNLVFGYIDSDGQEVAAISDSTYGIAESSKLREIVAIRVTVTGQTPSGKTRVLSTVVPLKNRH